MKHSRSIVLTLFFLLWTCVVNAQAPWCSTRVANPTPSSGDNFGYVVTRVDSNRFAVIAAGDDAGGTNASVIHILSADGALQRTITNLNPTLYSYGFRSLCMVGTNKLAAGIYGPSNSAVCVYDVNSGQLSNTIPDPFSGRGFGFAVADAGNDRMLVSSSATSVSNAVFLFTLSGAQILQVNNPDPAGARPFGEALAVIAPDRFVIGHAQANSFVGRAYLYGMDGRLIKTLESPVPLSFYQFGISVSSVGSNRIVVGAGAGNSGYIASAYLYDTNGTLITTITNPNPASGDAFGHSLARLGNEKFLVGASYFGVGGTAVGAAHVFTVDGSLIQTITNPSPSLNTGFGWRLAGLDSTRFVAGSPWDGAQSSEGGAAYLLTANGTDCNTNGICDETELRTNPSLDCNNDGKLDTCASCADMDVVFILDTSGSMGDVIQNLCDNMPAVVADLSSRSIHINHTFLSIVPGYYDELFSTCINGSISTKYGTAVPGSDPGVINSLGLTENRADGASTREDWGPAIAIVADRAFTNSGRTKLIVPITDTDPCPLAGPTNVTRVSYWQSILNAGNVAAFNNVIVSPVIKNPVWGGADPLTYASNVAHRTNGRLQFGVTTNTWRMVLNAVVAACDVSADCDQDGTPDECETDCDGNGQPDECEITQNPALDCDGNGELDACAIAKGVVADLNCDGIPDSCQGDATFRVVCSPPTSPHNFAIDTNCSARVYIPLQVTNGCPPVALTSSFTSGVFTNGVFSHRYRVGQHVVEITATDARGRKASCSSTISVIDNTGPRLLNP